MKTAYNNIIRGIRKYFKENNFKRAVIGLSGGIDSSLCAKLVADAIGSKNLLGLIMPDKGVTSRDSIDYAKKLANKLKIKHGIVTINSFLKPFKKMPWKENQIAVINTKARIRANILFNYANTHDAIVVGTTNKSEWLLGYFTKYGDSCADIEVIGDLWKTEVLELARFLKIPKEIIGREPTAELFHGHTDEKELGAKYEVIDEILKQIAAGKKPEGKLAKKIMERVKVNEHKRKAVPIIKK
ncbi:NAD(+) synthase [Candidatus Woesearchaeota archaeon]|nr:NAD(+) synthase [Candidatus Woesearchaeota archaeon]